MTNHIEYDENSSLSGFIYDKNKEISESNFEQRKRDPFITVTGLNNILAGNDNFLNDQETYELLKSPDIEEDRKLGISSSITVCFLELLILKYTIGDSIEKMVPLAQRTFKEFDRHHNEYTKVFHTYYPRYVKSEDESKYSLLGTNDYQYILWLLGLAYLFNLDEYIPKIATWISPRKKDGNDPLIATLFEKLGYPDILPTNDKLLHPKGYSDLWEVVKNPQDSQEIQSKRMKAYIQGWYRNVMGKTVWKGADAPEKVEIGAYFGFWSFEAAMVSVLYGLDDAHYRDMVFYPEDLADYAREKRQQR